MGAAPKSLAGLYAEQTRAQIGNTQGKAKKRRQQVYTPQEIVEFLLELWGIIYCDPCSGPDSIVPAHVEYYVPQDDEGEFRALQGELDGLHEANPWFDFTFVNPPFSKLKEWMLRALRESGRYGHEIVLLVPSRSHRKWWRRVANAADAVGELNPLPFRGEKSAAPFPLALIYFGNRPKQFAYLLEKHGLGEVRS